MKQLLAALAITTLTSVAQADGPNVHEIPDEWISANLMGIEANFGHACNFIVPYQGCIIPPGQVWLVNCSVTSTWGVIRAGLWEGIQMALDAADDNGFEVDVNIINTTGNDCDMWATQTSLRGIVIIKDTYPANFHNYLFPYGEWVSNNTGASPNKYSMWDKSNIYFDRDAIHAEITGNSWTTAERTIFLHNIGMNFALQAMGHGPRGFSCTADTEPSHTTPCTLKYEQTQGFADFTYAP